MHCRSFRRQVADMHQPSLYQRVLGADFERLDPVLRLFHGRDAGQAQGLLKIVSPPRWWAPLLVWVCRLPSAGLRGLRLDVSPCGRGQKWLRQIGWQRLVTTQSAGSCGLLEHHGPLTLAFTLQVRWGGLTMRSQRAWLCGVPLPSWFAPRVSAAVVPEPIGWRVRVRIRLPWLGEINRYEGSVICHDCLLEPAASAGSARRV
jgi:hypothetical protein